MPFFRKIFEVVLRHELWVNFLEKNFLEFLFSRSIDFSYFWGEIYSIVASEFYQNLAGLKCILDGTMQMQQ